METEEAQRVVPFQLQLDKPIASQIKIAEWNPEKDLLAMVTEDSKILLHRFKWQRLWTISPGKSITSLCWRPDGKAIAVGIEDGTVSLCDVENGKLLRSLKSHNVAVVCLKWEEDGQKISDDCTSISTYEDRTSRFLPPAPRVPQMLGVAVLTKDLCCLVVTCSEELTNNEEELENQSTALHEVISASLSVMRKQWSDAMHTFYEKFDSLSNLINDHGIDSSPQEEFLSLLGGARTSPPLPQFLVNSLGEVGVKRVSKVICGAGKELQLIVQNHLQPAAEIIGFRMGELRGLSRWHACYQVIGLDETLIDNATEKFSNFFNWLLKCIKLLMWEPSNQLLPYNSEHVVVFLKFLYEQDPVRQLLEASTGQNIDIDLEMMQRAKELVQFGGFSDCEFLQRTLAKGFHLMESYAHFIPLCCLLSCYRIFKEVFVMPFTSISKKILCEDLIPLFPHTSSSVSARIPMSVSYYKDASHAASLQPNCKTRFIDYISFQLPDESLPNVANCIRIVRGFTGGDIVLLLNETTITESSGDACIIIVEAMDLPFTSISRSTSMDHWKLHQLKEDSVVHLGIENEKVCSIPRTVMAPFAVSSSRGLACVFATRKRALVYILEEDEDEVSDAERSTS